MRWDEDRLPHLDHNQPDLLPSYKGHFAAFIKEYKYVDFRA